MQSVNNSVRSISVRTPFLDELNNASSSRQYGECHSIQLANGVEMPLLGLGTTHSGGYHHKTVIHALKECNYRMIDTARRYGIEREIGLAIEAAGVDRSSLFISTKLWPVDLGESAAYAACKRSCDLLGTDYLDLFLIHLPVVPDWFAEPKKAQEETWRAFERLYDEGIIKAIGVSNYSESDLNDLLEYCSVKPHVNQCEYHVCYNNNDLLEFCREENIAFTGYCPLAKGSILNDEAIKQVAQKHGKTAAQVCIRWSVQNGVPAIPKSRKIERIIENNKVFDFALDDDDMQHLSTLHDPNRKVIKLTNLQEKFSLPNGYKLKGKIFDVRESSYYINDFSGSDPTFDFSSSRSQQSLLI